MKTIIKPVITEKTLNNYKKNKKVTFEVNINTDKDNAKKSLENIYGVKISDVRVISRLGKYKTDRKIRKLNKLSDKKIMIFTLKDNSEIDIFKN